MSGWAGVTAKYCTLPSIALTNVSRRVWSARRTRRLTFAESHSSVRNPCRRDSLSVSSTRLVSLLPECFSVKATLRVLNGNSGGTVVSVVLPPLLDAVSTRSRTTFVVLFTTSTAPCVSFFSPAIKSGIVLSRRSSASGWVGGATRTRNPPRPTLNNRSFVPRRIWTGSATLPF